jgi:hypothetical protein
MPKTEMNAIISEIGNGTDTTAQLNQTPAQERAKA